MVGNFYLLRKKIASENDFFKEKKSTNSNDGWEKLCFMKTVENNIYDMIISTTSGFDLCCYL